MQDIGVKPPVVANEPERQMQTVARSRRLRSIVFRLSVVSVVVVGLGVLGVVTFFPSGFGPWSAFLVVGLVTTPSWWGRRSSHPSPETCPESRRPSRRR